MAIRETLEVIEMLPIPLIGKWEKETKGSLQVYRHKSFRKAPFDVSVNVPLLHDVLNDLRLEDTSLGDFTKAQIFIERPVTPERFFGQMETYYPWEPLKLRLFGGNFYRSYLEQSEKTNPEDSLIKTQDTLVTTLAHEIIHFKLLSNPWFVMQFGLMSPDLVEEMRNNLGKDGRHWNDTEVITEALAWELVRSNQELRNSISFSVK